MGQCVLCGERYTHAAITGCYHCEGDSSDSTESSTTEGEDYNHNRYKYRSTAYRPTRPSRVELGRSNLPPITTRASYEYPSPNESQSSDAPSRLQMVDGTNDPLFPQLQDLEGLLWPSPRNSAQVQELDSNNQSLPQEIETKTDVPQSITDTRIPDIEFECVLTPVLNQTFPTRLRYDSDLSPLDLSAIPYQTRLHSRLDSRLANQWGPSPVLHTISEEDPSPVTQDDLSPTSLVSPIVSPIVPSLVDASDVKQNDIESSLSNFPTFSEFSELKHNARLLSRDLGRCEFNELKVDGWDQDEVKTGQVEIKSETKPQDVCQSDTDSPPSSPWLCVSDENC